MATSTLPGLQAQGTSLEALLGSLFSGQQGNVSNSSNISSNVSSSDSAGESFSNSSGSSVTTPGFVAEMGQFIQQMMGGNSRWSANNAMQSALPQVQQLAIDTLQQNMPSVNATSRNAGAYNSTTQQLLNNDLQSRLAGQMAALGSQRILDFATQEQNVGNMLANMARAATSQSSTQQSSSSSSQLSRSQGNAVSTGNSSAQPAGNMSAGLGGALASAAIPALGQLARGLIGGSSGSDWGITDAMNMPSASWGTGWAPTNNSYFSLGSNNDWGSGISSGYNFTPSHENWGFARGGEIPGKEPADRSKDNVTINARSGEYVLIPEVVDAFGADFFDKLNAAFMPKNLKKGSAGFATGGRVGSGVPKAVYENGSESPSNWREIVAATEGQVQQANNGQRQYFQASMPTSLTVRQAGTVNGATNILDTMPVLSDPNVRSGLDPNTGIPIIDLNSAEGLNYLNTTKNLGGVGDYGSGFQALFSSKTEQGRRLQQGQIEDSSDVKYLAGLGQALGFDMAQYDLGKKTKDQRSANGLRYVDSNATKADAYDLLEDIKSASKNLFRVDGFSSGWDGSVGKPRNASSTMYYRGDDNVLRPIQLNSQYTAPETTDSMKDFWTMAAGILTMPFGGWAGMLGNAMGATSAGAALGATGLASTAINAGVNSLANYAVSGNPTSLASGLGGFLGGWGGNTLGQALGSNSSTFAQVGSQLGSRLGSQLYQQSRSRG